MAENMSKIIKTKLYKYFRLNPNANLGTTLDTFVKTYNATPNKYGFTPNAADSGLLDPYIRNKVYPHRISLTPFPQFYKSQLLLQKKIKQPNPKGIEQNLESEDDYRVSDYVFINFPVTRLNRQYNVKRARIYRIRRIDTRERPYLFVLETLNGQRIDSTFYSNELARAKNPNEFPKAAEIEKVLKTRTLRNGQKQAFISYKYYPR